MRFISLFAGIGGFDLGLERAGMTCVGQVEIDPFCQKVLAKHWPGVLRHDDIRTYKGTRGAAELLCGGFPCQPFSAAGKRRGTEDDRHLWPEMARVIAEVRPAWVVGENVTGIIGLALDGVLSDLEGMGYAIWPVVLPACSVDAPHRRDRIWIVAHDDCQRKLRRFGEEGPTPNQSEGEVGQQDGEWLRHVASREGASDNVADASGQGLQGTPFPELAKFSGTSEPSSWSELSRGTSEKGATWPAEPNVGRVAHGVPRRVDRLRSLGNAVVPQIPEIIGRAILDAEQAA